MEITPANEIEPADSGKGIGDGGGRPDKGPLAQVKKRPAAPRPPNDFLCVPKYYCQPPEPPMDLKLIDLEPDLSFYAPYRTTDLDINHTRPMYTNSTFGVRVNLVNLNEYNELAQGETPVAEDAPLLESDSEVATDGTIRRKSSAPAPFLRAMFYDEYKIDKIDYGGASRKVTKVKRKSREELLAEVQFEFQVVKNNPVHPNPRKRQLKPVENIPIFPDFENHHNKYVVVQFEDDPKKSVKLALERNLDPTVKLQNEEGQEMVNTAVTIGSRGEDNEPFLGYYVPVDDEIERRKQRRTDKKEMSDRYGTADSEDYLLAREFVFDVRARETATEVQKLFLLSQHEGFASYSEVSSRLSLHTRKKSIREAGEDAPQTKRLILRRRNRNSTDHEEKIESILQMCVRDDTAEIANQLEQ